MMINRIKKLFDRIDSGDDVQPDGAELNAMAAAVLMVEAARLDGDFNVSERQSIHSIVTRHFRLDEEEADELISEAEAVHDDTNHLIKFTRAIKNSYSPQQRIANIEMLWEVVYADGVLHDYEANLLRRIGGLIYVSDHDRGAARKRVLNRLGIE